MKGLQDTHLLCHIHTYKSGSAQTTVTLSTCKVSARICDPYPSIIFIMTYKDSTEHHFSKPESKEKTMTGKSKRQEWDAGMWEGLRVCQSTSVWSRGRYLIPCTSSSCSTSSGIRPFTVIAYTPRTYLSSPVCQHPHKQTKKEGREEVRKAMDKNNNNGKRTRSLPPRHPAFLRIRDRNGAVKMRRCTRLNAVR